MNAAALAGDAASPAADDRIWETLVSEPMPNLWVLREADAADDAGERSFRNRLDPSVCCPEPARLPSFLEVAPGRRLPWRRMSGPLSPARDDRTATNAILSPSAISSTPLASSAVIESGALTLLPGRERSHAGVRRSRGPGCPIGEAAVATIGADIAAPPHQ